MSVDKDVVSKIKKLLNHHKGCLKVNSEEEACVALDMARRLMDEHHLDMMQFSESLTDEEDILERCTDKFSVYSVPLWIHNIIGVVSNVCNCTCIMQKTRKNNGYTTVLVNFIGQKCDMDSINELYLFLKKSTHKLANEHVGSIQGNYTRWRSFAEGFTSRLLERSRTYNSAGVEMSDVSDAVDVYDVDDEDFTESTTEESEANACRALQLADYAKSVRTRIDEYIKNNVDNVVYEQKKLKSRVFIDSYMSGRKMGEKHAISLVDKKHRIGE